MAAAVTLPRDEGARGDMSERVLEWVTAGLPLDTVGLLNGRAWSEV